MNKKESFSTKWKDKKYQAKVKLSIYGVFILIVIILGSIGNNSSLDNSNTKDIDNNISDNSTINDSKDIFMLPKNKDYKYNIDIKLDDKEIKYNGEVNDVVEVITKDIDNVKYSYKYIDKKYYVSKNNNYVLTSRDNIYDIVDYSYIDNDIINSYLEEGKLVGNKSVVYIKDIVLDYKGNDYITYTLSDKKIEIDYTKLYNILNDNKIDSLVIKIEYIY